MWWRVSFANLTPIPVARTKSAIYRSTLATLIIPGMLSESSGNKEHTRGSGPEFLKGCPVCEHSDPELERELRAFGQLLLEIHLAKRKIARESKKDGD
jgi:hypothetical protein